MERKRREEEREERERREWREEKAEREGVVALRPKMIETREARDVPLSVVSARLL